MGTAWLTAYRMLFVKSGLRPGQTMLVQGASGGVSTALVQLGRAAGLQVWVTGRTEGKRALAAQAGAHATFPNGGAAARAGRRRVRDHQRRRLGAFDALAEAGRHHRGLRAPPVARTPGPTCSVCSSCSCGWTGSTMGTRAELADLLTFVTNAGIAPEIGLELPLQRAEEGFRAMAAGETGGKIVFTQLSTGATRSRTHPAFGCGALGHQQVQSVTVSEPSSRTASGSVYVPAPRVTGLVELLDRVDRAVAAALAPVTAAEGVSRDGWRVLLMLARGGGRSMGEIASHTALPAPTATRVVDKLVDSGLASRRTDPVDRRRVLVHLAANGRAVIERVCGRVERKIGAALGSAHTPERAQLAELLEALARRPSGS